MNEVGRKKTTNVYFFLEIRKVLFCLLFPTNDGNHVYLQIQTFMFRQYATYFKKPNSDYYVKHGYLFFFHVYYTQCQYILGFIYTNNEISIETNNNNNKKETL